jgi:hypothetical protein
VNARQAGELKLSIETSIERFRKFPKPESLVFRTGKFRLRALRRVPLSRCAVKRSRDVVRAQARVKERRNASGSAADGSLLLGRPPRGLLLEGMCPLFAVACGVAARVLSPWRCAAPLKALDDRVPVPVAEDLRRMAQHFRLHGPQER